MLNLFESSNYESEDGDCFQLTLSQRILGFIGCALIGMFSGVLSIFAIALLRIRKFSLLFAIFNLMVLSSTGFLIGFKKQFRSLTDRKRILACIGMFSGMILTFISAFRWKILIGVILGFSIEVVSFIYYAFSILPMGTTLFHKLFW